MKKYTLKVYPEGESKMAYRVLEIGGSKTLDDLCMLILHAFDFIHEHLYEFCMDNIMYNSENSYQYEPEEGERSTDIAINKLALEQGQIFSLHYDYGDDWMFNINVQKIEDVKGRIKPAVIESKGCVEQYPEYDDEDEDE